MVGSHKRYRQQYFWTYYGFRGIPAASVGRHRRLRDGIQCGDFRSELRRVHLSMRRQPELYSMPASSLGYRPLNRCATAQRGRWGRLRVLAGCLVIASVGAPRPVNAQLGNASITPQAGIMSGGEAAASVGFELRVLESHRVALSLGAGRWWRFVGCDALVGSPCDDGGWSTDLGVVAHFARRGDALAFYAAPRIGVLYYDLFDRRVWKPSVGIGVTWSSRRALGFLAEIRYDAVTRPRPSSLTSRPPTDDHVAFVAGVRLRL